jgi:2-polyprenyl-3-methyl-5-hydroxy-6-metoxy-1,4-benzoquinol methylase
MTERDPPPATTSKAAETNRAVYNDLWPKFSDFIRYNPGARHRRRHVLRFLDGLQFDSLLDVGCGNAELLRIVDARYPGKKLRGVDLSETVVAQNRRVFAHMQFDVNNIENDPLGVVVDVVLCTEVIEHLDHPERALRHIAAALPSGGHAVITTPTGKVHATEKHFGHIKHPRPRELAALAESAGFEVRELLSWGFPMYALTKWATNLNPEAALSRFGGERSYGVLEKAVSLGLDAANHFNLENSPLGVQLFALLRKR